jgi:cell division protein FtsW (lipid II flippase)
MWLLLFAAGLVTAAFALVEANQELRVSSHVFLYSGLFAGVLLLAHLAVRRWAPYADPLILPCVALLNGLGLVMIYRISLAKAENSTAATAPSTTGDVTRQLVWTGLSLILFIIVLVIVRDHRTLARYGYTFGFVGLTALVLPGVLPYSISGVNGAKVWLKLGAFSIQPGEFAKIMLIIFVASFLVSKRDLFVSAGRTFLGFEFPRLRDLGPLIAALCISAGVLALEKDMGNSLLIFGVVLVMVYVATGRATWIVLGLVPFMGACVLAYNLFTHVQQRVNNWSNPFSNYYGAGGGYQIAQSLFGLGTGGLFGTGLGAGRPDMVPEANSDFIISALGEELGFVGLAVVLIIYMFLTMRGVRSALAVRDTFGKLLGGGLAFSMLWQVFVVIGGVTNLIPETGLTTPFVSAGGSSLLANYILVALLLRLSDAARKPPVSASKPEPPKVPLAESHTVLVERP